jgi:hypothetical protein
VSRQVCSTKSHGPDFGLPKDKPACAAWVACVRPHVDLHDV